jgi:hypothetical protein
MGLFYARQANREKMGSPFRLSTDCQHFPNSSFGRKFSGHATLEEAPYNELLLQNDLFLKHQ